MMQYNRYLRRTFYYIDVIDENNEIVRVNREEIHTYGFFTLCLFVVFILW
jgi:hypothetical protein